MIEIKLKEEREGEWVFEVVVGEGSDTTFHKVVVPYKYWQDLTDETAEPEVLIRKSFEFLLAREKKEVILGEFELPVIVKYFPNYEEEIRKLFLHNYSKHQDRRP